MKGADPNTAAKLCCKITWFVSFFLIAYGIYGSIEHHAAAPFYLLVPLYLSFSAYQLWTMAKNNDAGKHPLFAPTG